MVLSASLSNNWAPSIECINIGCYSTPLVIVDTDAAEAEHWLGLAPNCSAQWSLSRDCSLTSELTSQVPKNYQDYLLEVISASLKANYSTELFSARDLLLNSVSSHYSFVSWSQWSNLCSAGLGRNEPLPLQKVAAMIGHFKQAKSLNIIHYLSTSDAGIDFYRHKRTGIEWQTSLDSLNIGGLNSGDFELLYHCPAKAGRLLIFPSNLCQSLTLSRQGLQSDMLSIRSQLSFSKPVF